MVIIQKLMEEGIELLKCKNKPALSVLLYIFSGMIGLLSIISLISPFHINVGFLDNIVWKDNIANDDLLIKITFQIVVICFIFKILGRTIINFYQKKTNMEVRIIYVRVYTIEDILDLLCSIFCLLLMLSVFIQIYNTRILFISWKACFVYIWILSKVFDFWYRRFEVVNLKIIDNVLRKYSDMG